MLASNQQVRVSISENQDRFQAGDLVWLSTTYSADVAHRIHAAATITAPRDNETPARVVSVHSEPMVHKNGIDITPWFAMVETLDEMPQA